MRRRFPVWVSLVGEEKHVGWRNAGDRCAAGSACWPRVGRGRCALTSRKSRWAGVVQHAWPDHRAGPGSGVFLKHIYEELGANRSVVILESRRRYLAGLREAFTDAQLIQAAPEDLQHLPLINCKFSSAVICCRSIGRQSQRAMAAIMRGSIMHLYHGQSLWMYGYGRIPHYLSQQVSFHGAAAETVIPGPGSAGASLLRVSSR